MTSDVGKPNPVLGQAQNVAVLNQFLACVSARGFIFKAFILHSFTAVAVTTSLALKKNEIKH